MNKRKKSFIGLAIFGPLAFIFLGAGGCDQTPDAVQQDRSVSNDILSQYQKAQPVPIFPWSQLRQNVIEIETSQANTTLTTSFFFNQGVTDPISSCPSIGFPIPMTYQLTAPEVPIYLHDSTSGQVPQLEPTGVYTGDTSATTVTCIGEDGKGYFDYWEGNVKAVTGPAEWDYTNHRIKMTGTSSAKITVKK